MMKPQVILAWVVLSLFYSFGAMAQNYPVAHWVDSNGNDAGSVLNSNINGQSVFTTTFKTTNDLLVTRSTADSVLTSIDVFGGSSPGNNPLYLTQFVGVSGNGTGDGTAGDIEDLNMTSDATSTVQFDFLSRLTQRERILLVDIDGPEQYTLQAYVKTNSSYVQASLAGWIPQQFTGTTGELPNSQWPVWNGSAGTVNSGTSANLNEELFVLTPDQPIDRLIINKLTGSTWSTAITFISLAQTNFFPIPLQIQSAGTNVILSWTNSAFALQVANGVNGPFTNVLNASSPFTTGATNTQRFFRLIVN